MVQLTPEEADVYRECPVVLDFESGFYIFPVTYALYRNELDQTDFNQLLAQ